MNGIAPRSVYQAEIGTSPWTRLDTGNLPTDIRYNAFAISPLFDQDQTLIIAGWSPSTGVYGLYVSRNAGQTWESKLSVGIYDLRASPRFDTDRTYLAGAMNDIYRSTDGGTSWQTVDTPPGLGNGFGDFEYSPAYAIDNTVLTVVGSHGVYRSTDRGASWGPYIDPGPSGQISLSPGFSVDHILFAASGVVQKYTGASPETLTLPGDAGAARGVATSPDYVVNQTVFAGTVRATFRSTDDGSTWTRVVSVPMSDIIWSPTYSSDHTGWMITPGAGVLETQDGGDTWSLMNDGLQDSSVTDLYVVPRADSVEAVFAAVPGGGPFATADIGNDWEWLGAGITTSLDLSIAASPTYDQDGLILAGTSDTGMFRSTDGGISWRNVGPTDIYAVHVNRIAMSPEFASDSIVVASASMGTFRSTDRGLSWTKMQGTSAAWDFGFSPHFGADQTIVVGSENGILISTDRGDTWQYSNEGLPEQNPPYAAPIPAVAFSPYYASDRTVFAGTYLYGVYRSTDGGMTWAPAIDGLLHPRIIAFTTLSHGDGTYTLYASTRLDLNHALYESNDGGNQWTQILVPFDSSVEIGSLAVLPLSSGLVVGTAGRGVWYYGESPGYRAIQPATSEE